MKILVENYTFDASAKTITFTDYVSIALEQVRLVTNVTDGTIIFNFAKAGLTGSVATNVLTLDFDTSAMSDSDALSIDFDDFSAATPGDATAANQATEITALGTLHTDLGTTIHGDLGTLHTDLNTTIHGDLGTLHTDLGTTIHADLNTTIHGDLGGTTDTAVVGDTAGSLAAKLRGLNKVAGTTTDSAITSDSNGTVIGFLRGLCKIFGDVWDSTNHWLKTSSQVQLNPINGNLTLTATGDNAILAAPGSSIVNYVTAWSGSNTSATPVRVDIKDGSTVKASYYLAASGGGFALSSSMEAPLLKQTSNTALNMAMSGAVTDVRLFASGYKI